VQFARNLPAFAVSRTGTVAWRVGFSTTPSNGRMRLLDSTGREVRAFVARAPWAPRLSPDGRRLAYGAAGPSRTTSDLWVTDLADGSTQRITNDSSDANDPVWSPDGRELAMSAASPDTGWKSVELRRLDGGAARRFATATLFAIPSDWSRDGSTLLITTVDLRDVSSAHAKPLAGGASRKLFDGDGRGGARFSPDGKWIAYTSDETGRRQVYVQSWPALDGKMLVSTRGGVHPVWAREGLALFYWQDDELVSVRLAARAGGGLEVASRAALFRAPYLESLQPNYDVLPGGRQFVVVTWRARANRIAVAVDALGGAR
jgi:Tol biopolymer transport system component